MLDSPVEDDVMLVTEYMAGGAIMEYNNDINKFVFSISAAAIMNGIGYLPMKYRKASPEYNQVNDKNNRRAMTGAEALSASYDLLSGLKYLHSKGISHR